MRPSDILAQHEETRGNDGSHCSCGAWQTINFPGGPDIAAWSWATHLIESLEEAGYEVRKKPEPTPDPGPTCFLGCRKDCNGCGRMPATVTFTRTDAS